MRKMRILLIEDEKEHCAEYKSHVQTLEYHPELYIAHGEEEGLKKFQIFPIDIVILDLELRESDGDGIMFLKKAKRLNVHKNPFTIVITHNISEKAIETARKSGADYVFCKTKPDYSPKNVMDFARYQFLLSTDTAGDFPESTAAKTVEEEIRSDMDKISMTDKLTGKKYIIDAIALGASLGRSDIKLEKDIYPAIARKYSKNPGAVAKAIENVIRDAWSMAEPETLAENYTIPLSLGKGTPTNKDFICYYVNKIRDAGKA